MTLINLNFNAVFCTISPNQTASIKLQFIRLKVGNCCLMSMKTNCWSNGLGVS